MLYGIVDDVHDDRKSDDREIDRSGVFKHT